MQKIVNMAVEYDEFQRVFLCGHTDFKKLIHSENTIYISLPIPSYGSIHNNVLEWCVNRFGIENIDVNLQVYTLNNYTRIYFKNDFEFDLTEFKLRWL